VVEAFAQVLACEAPAAAMVDSVEDVQNWDFSAAGDEFLIVAQSSGVS